jgi:nucleotide sugar dehydrogenase
MWNKLNEFKNIKKISVIGLGYIGLPTLVAIAKTGKYEVVGFDINQQKIDQIKKGKSPIEDPDVVDYLKENKAKVSSDPDVIKDSDVFIICVPTPVLNDYTPDYGPVISATETVANYLKPGNHYVLESTVNPGTCEEVVMPILEKATNLKAGKDFNIADCPERVNPGDPKWTIYNINRNIGSITPDLNSIIADFYRDFITDAKVHEVSTLKVAEATKIVENTFRDINIAFVNELAKSFDSLGIDLHETLTGAANKPFAFMAHWPGCGVGGHCIAVDPYYLIKRASQNGFNHRFLKLARDINNSMPEYTVDKLIEALNEVKLPVKGTKIALLGLSYKPNVGDLRESPSLEIKAKLEKLGADLITYDPYVKEGSKSLKDAVKESQAVLICTAHDEIIKNLPKELKNSSVKVLVDGRNCLDKNNIKDLGILYSGIGR